MELEALQGIYSEVRALGAGLVVITPELERCLSLCSHCPTIFASFTNRLEARWTGSTTSRDTGCPCRRGTSSIRRASFARLTLTPTTRFAPSLPKRSNVCGTSQDD